MIGFVDILSLQIRKISISKVIVCFSFTRNRYFILVCFFTHPRRFRGFVSDLRFSWFVKRVPVSEAMRPAVQSRAAASELSVPCRLQVATSVTRYRSCTVDPGPSRVVHCPDLNACLVNEGRPANTQVSWQFFLKGLIGF